MPAFGMWHPDDFQFHKEFSGGAEEIYGALAHYYDLPWLSFKAGTFILAKHIKVGGGGVAARHLHTGQGGGRGGAARHINVCGGGEGGQARSLCAGLADQANGPPTNQPG